MKRVSSNLTLAFKIFFPILWTVFFLGITLVAWFSGIEYVGDMPIATFRIGITAFLLIGIAFIYWAFLRLKRVEMDEQFVYVTNYFKHFRYPYHNIEKITFNNYLLFKSVNIHLKEAGNFGKKMTFVPSRKLFRMFTETHPELFVDLIKEN